MNSSVNVLKKMAKCLVPISALAYACFSGSVAPFDVLSPCASQLFFVFLSSIIIVIAGGVRIGVVAFCALSIVIMCKILPFNKAMSGFSNGTPWLVFFAFCFSKAFTKSGLGGYLSYLLASRSKGNFKVFARYLAFLDFFVAPFVPSNAARAGSTTVPVLTNAINSLSKGSDNLAVYLVMMTFVSGILASALFLTGTAPNLLSLSLAKSMTGVSVTWMDWFLYMVFPTIAMMFLALIIVPKVLGIRAEDFPDLPLNMQHKTLSKSSKKLIVIFLCVLFFWMFGDRWGISSVQAAFVGVAALMVVNVLDWEDLTHHSSAWDNFFWYGGFISMAASLSEQKVFVELGALMSKALQSFGPEFMYVVGGLIYVLAHYFFAGISPYVMSLYPVFLLMFLEKGVPSTVAVVGLGGLATLSAVFTHYGSTLCPLYYGLNIVSIKTWWRVGAFVGLTFYGVMTAYGFIVWKCFT